jgi:hypothetical protein
MKFLYGRANDRGLALMTCGGVFHRDGTGYDHKLLVYASLVLPHPAAPAKGNKPHR